MSPTGAGTNAVSLAPSGRCSCLPRRMAAIMSIPQAFQQAFSRLYVDFNVGRHVG